MAISISFPFISSDHANAQLRDLMTRQPEKGVETVKSILNMWQQRDKEGMRKFIGDVVDRDFFGVRLMYTLTADRTQFRAWYGVPGVIGHSHVDSCGSGELLTIFNESPAEVEQLITELFDDAGLSQYLKVPNGTRIYGLSWRNF